MPKYFSKIINFIIDKNQSTIIGYLFAILMFISSLIKTLCSNNFIQRVFFVSSRVSTACMGLIYKKVNKVTKKNHNN